MIRTITVEARNSVMNAEDMVPRLADGLARLRADLPPNHFIEYDGVVAESKEAQAALQANAPLCLGMILILLVTLFNSYRRPVIIMLTAPLIIIGVVIGLFVMRATFGFMEILGIYALAGIIMNNAIVLINRFDIERADPDKSDFDAIVSASMRRLRPILMTMGTTVIGLMPLIIGRDALFYGMSSVIAFGLAVGTILTLGVTPVLYSLFFRIRYQPRSPS
jgi:multidrug efflux pump subunit AcrB